LLCLCSLQLVAKDELTSDDDVFDDMFLLRLSLTPPSGLYASVLGIRVIA
jgi:hypothetical protein